MRGLKDLFDPHAIFNPNKLLPAIDGLAADAD
jgi:FAD/FMN-containing dehydrogenase